MRLEFIGFFLLFGCKTGLFKSSEDKNELEQKKQLNQVSIESIKVNATINTEIGSIAVNSKREVESMIVLDLKYFPDPQLSKATLPQCYAPIGAEQKIGEIRCAGTEKVAVFAAHVSQQCEVDKNKGLEKSTNIVLSTSCKTPILFLHDLSPKVPILLK